MVSASMPHSKVKGLQYKRENSHFILSMIGNESVGGLPYGVYPRLILSWLATEVVKTKSRKILLGSSLSSFMKDLGLCVTGGRWGTISRFKDQMKKLFSAHISLSYEDKQTKTWIVSNMNVADNAQIFWDPHSPNQLDLFKSHVLLGEQFFEEIIQRPIPINIKAINSLKDSSLALDIYFWLTYRLNYLKHSLKLSFKTLHSQFGSGYADTPQGHYQFKRKFVLQIKKVLAVYQDARVEIENDGVLLLPSFPHIKKRNSL